jgi:hypothetical protein
VKQEPKVSKEQDLGSLSLHKGTTCRKMAVANGTSSLLADKPTEPEGDKQ